MRKKAPKAFFSCDVDHDLQSEDASLPDLALMIPRSVVISTHRRSQFLCRSYCNVLCVLCFPQHRYHCKQLDHELIVLRDSLARLDLYQVRSTRVIFPHLKALLCHLEVTNHISCAFSRSQKCTFPGTTNRNRTHTSMSPPQCSAPETLRADQRSSGRDPAQKDRTVPTWPSWLSAERHQDHLLENRSSIS